VRLLQREGAEQTNRCMKKAVVDNLLTPDKLMNKFYGELVRCKRQCQEEARARDDLDDQKNQLRYIDDRIKLRRHGPAVQMDVNDIKMDVMNFDADRQAVTSTKFYSVDMVPAIEILHGNGKDYYVAKPVKGFSGPELVWRRSFSLEEKKRLVTADDGNLCHRKVYRTLKVIKNNNVELKKLTSYHLKTVVFRVMDQRSAPEDWKNERFGERLMDVLEQSKKELHSGVMPHYYIPEYNLLDDFKVATARNMGCRFTSLMNNEEKMLKLLKVSTESENVKQCENHHAMLSAVTS